jgi:hypothetical protein
MLREHLLIGFAPAHPTAVMAGLVPAIHDFLV